jgi:hypothetical protein
LISRFHLLTSHCPTIALAHRYDQGSLASWKDEAAASSDVFCDQIKRIADVYFKFLRGSARYANDANAVPVFDRDFQWMAQDDSLGLGR